MAKIFAAGVIDMGGKFATTVIDTGGIQEKNEFMKKKPEAKISWHCPFNGQCKTKSPKPEFVNI